MKSIYVILSLLCISFCVQCKYKENYSNSILLNGYNIFYSVNNIDSLCQIIGKPDSIICDGKVNEEFGYKIYEMQYGRSSIIITDSYISDFWIKDEKLNINGVTYGSDKKELNKLCSRCSDSLALHFLNPESSLHFEINSDGQINMIEFNVLIN